jgi:uncharacterized protein (DUF58 family)
MPTAHEHPTTRQVLACLELRINRCLAGAVHGDYQGIFPGPGSDTGEARVYVPGDDVRLIDWNLTARTNEPHVRDPIADHELDVWLVVDISASQAFGTAGGQKRDLALFAAAAFGFAAARQANRIGAVLAGGETTRLIPPRTGRHHLLSILHRVAEADPAATPTGRTDLAPALAHTAGYARRRGFIAVVSDFRLAPGWQTELHRLSQRHSIVAVEVTDPLEHDLPAVGRIVVEDPETGARLEVNTSDAALRARYRAHTRDDRDRLARAITQTGADHLVLHTGADWIGEVVRFFAQRRQRLAGYRRVPWQG